MGKYNVEIIEGDKTRRVSLIGDESLVKKRIAKWGEDGKCVTCKEVGA